MLCTKCGERSAIVAFGTLCEFCHYVIEPIAQVSKAEEMTTKFGTGARRSSDAETVRYDLISPIAIQRLNGEFVTRVPAEPSAQYNRAINSIYEFLSGDRNVSLERAAFFVGYLISGTTPPAECHGVCDFPAKALEVVAETCCEGARKYDDFNWEKGMDVPDLLNHAIRHLILRQSGDTSEPHLAHALWGIFAAIHSYHLWPHLNAGKLREPGCKPPIPEPAK